MEYKKGPNGFTLEFNELEEANLEKVISTLKNRDEFSHLSSNLEFIALILNEGVASLQQSTDSIIDREETDDLASFQEVLSSLLNQSLAALQHGTFHPMKEKVRLISFEELINTVPDFDSLFQEIEKSMELDKNPEFRDIPPILPLDNFEEPPKN